MIKMFIFVFFKNVNMVVGLIVIIEIREKVVDFIVLFMYYIDDLLVKKILIEIIDLL